MSETILTVAPLFPTMNVEDAEIINNVSRLTRLPNDPGSSLLVLRDSLEDGLVNGVKRDILKADTFGCTARELALFLAELNR